MHSIESFRGHLHRLGMRVRRVFIDAPLDLVREMAYDPLHRPGGAIAESTDRVTLDLRRHLHQHIDLALLRSAFRHAREYPPHPAHAFAARRALAAALMLVEIGNARHGAHD